LDRLRQAIATFIAIFITIEAGRDTRWLARGTTQGKVRRTSQGLLATPRWDHPPGIAWGGATSVAAKRSKRHAREWSPRCTRERS